jgi:cell division protein FtsB
VTDFEQRKRVKRVLFSKATSVILAIILILLGRITWRIYQKERDSRDRVTQLTREAGELENRRDDLATSLTRLKTDRGAEDEIRTKFAVVKEGERIIQIVEPHGTTSTTTEPKKGWWQRFLGLF